MSETYNPPADITWETDGDGAFVTLVDGQRWLLWRRLAWEGKRGYAKKATWHLAPLLGDSTAYDSDRCRYIAPHRNSDLPRAKKVAAWILANQDAADRMTLGDIEAVALS